MKTLFFKKGIIFLATLFVAGITLSCSNDEEWTKSEQLGYWYNDQFIELTCSSTNLFLVQARATDNPISTKKVEKILKSLGAEEIHNSGAEYFFVTAKTRPSHPDLFVSQQYKHASNSNGRDWLYICPQISMRLNEGASVDDILNKYGKHLKVKEKVVSPSTSVLYTFDCDLSTSEDILKLAAAIHVEPSVKWCEPDKLSNLRHDY